ncbi:golgi uridine diphosphate-N- acetylglucosamine transporter [Malassezia cuniculi]|uniref:Golgi uridine diphosphate-N- acetylglucosamine transporter n=1 Tax=Malassezia cuniculi TaxID=948313 RepID=A0AAF0J614_9BASI|nr:golgi uridine diphosphate-N- acetylglucosamine transporter [Malassezia cuniculi]
MAFAYAIPMAVHIIFRSGGMVVNMLLGWLVDRKKYSLLQVTSVLLVSAGVVTSTLSAQDQKSAAVANAPASTYAVGIIILTIALFSSGAMGIFQERTFRKYGRDVWHESLFFSHLLSLPLFILHYKDISLQASAANATPKVWVGVSQDIGLWLPSFYIGLALNVLTQLICINGVNRLTARVSSLSVSLILVVRKAISLIISVVVINHDAGSLWLWIGASWVLIGTVGYTYGGIQGALKKKKE